MRKSMRRMFTLFVSVWVLFIVFSKDALAYIDPGSGSYLGQMLVALFAGAAYTVSHWWRNIIGFFKRIFSKKK